MFDLRPILLHTGLTLVLLALAMTLPAAVDAAHGHGEWLVFAAAAAATLFGGLLLMAGNQGRRIGSLSLRQTFLLTLSCWLAAALAGALPFVFSGLGLSVTDALFESVSGVTASGATVLRGLDHLPPGLLLWRALLQWLGGGGVLVLSVLVLPALHIGGMQIFRLETVGDQVAPRAAKVIGGLLAIYLAFTAALTLLLWGVGMSRFPALLQAMTTISCGGFSTVDGSVGAWHSPPVDWVILGGMLAGGAPFVLYLQIAQRRWRLALRNSQLHWYLSVFLAAGLGLAAWLLFAHNIKPLPALRHGAFTAASVLTGSGFATLDFGQWHGLPVAILFFLTFVGGCAGSTAGGIKIFRFQVLLANARMQMARLLRPNAVLLPSYEGQPISDAVAGSVLGFLFVYILAFAILSMLLSMLGLDFLSAISSAAAALANLGPGLTSAVGPLTGYGALPDAAKWLLSAAMLFGRLELFTVLVLFSRSFWKP